MKKTHEIQVAFCDIYDIYVICYIYENTEITHQTQIMSFKKYVRIWSKGLFRRRLGKALTKIFFKYVWKNDDSLYIHYLNDYQSNNTQKRKGLEANSINLGVAVYYNSLHPFLEFFNLMIQHSNLYTHLKTNLFSWCCHCAGLVQQTIC